MKITIRCTDVHVTPSDASGFIVVAEVADAREFQNFARPSAPAEALAAEIGEMGSELERWAGRLRRDDLAQVQSLAIGCRVVATKIRALAAPDDRALEKARIGHAFLKDDIERLHRDLRALLDDRDGNVHVWSEVDDNDLASLCCPILIEPHVLRALAAPDAAPIQKVIDEMIEVAEEYYTADGIVFSEISRPELRRWITGLLCSIAAAKKRSTR